MKYSCYSFIKHRCGKFSYLDDSDGHEFLAVVATVHHERVNETLNDGALSLTEPFDLVSARGVGQELL